jgi:hypothetical protein
MNDKQAVERPAANGKQTSTLRYREKWLYSTKKNLESAEVSAVLVWPPSIAYIASGGSKPL